MQEREEESKNNEENGRNSGKGRIGEKKAMKMEEGMDD